MNKDNYKDAINQIHASDELKEKTFENSSKVKYIKFRNLKLILASVAVVIIVFFIGFDYVNSLFNKELPDSNSSTMIATIDIDDLPRFESMEELKEVLSENTNNLNVKSESNKETYIDSNSVKQTTTTTTENVSEFDSQKNFSTTNLQVEDVDEADIVKTDGDFIYYVNYGDVYIVRADTLEIISKISNKTEKDNFYTTEIFLNNNKLIVLGNYVSYQEQVYQEKSMQEVYTDVARINSSNFAKAIIYDISNKNNPKVLREVSLDGKYINSRMIGDNIYFVSRKNAYYSDSLKDEEILPIVKDSISTSKTISYKDIIYFKDTKNYNYMLVGGFNINNNDEVNIETFFGASDKMYVSQNNLYLTQTTYGVGVTYSNSKTTIYKFNLDNSYIKLLCKGEVNGYLDSQFSMDEYNGNLRLATTIVKEVEPGKEEYIENTNIINYTLPKTITSNSLYILDDNLEEISKIDNLAEGEKIYSVRFIGKIGYIVTFEQIDPLFVIDLSDPENPVVKGELKVPGYSSYLHPYDETHIIGIGNNVKSNGHGGVTNDNMKMSMFDVSDIENPKEIFSVDIGNSYTYSEISYNHKVLFYNKYENLIGFPITISGKNYKNGIVIFRINLNDNKFEKYGEIFNQNDFRTNVNRVIYIQDTLYTLGNYKIISYDLNTLEKIKELNLDNNF